jgi:stringent starvation protein B
MTSTKPYLLRAIFDWCVDQGFTPHLQVRADASARVPREYVRDGQIVLNVGPEATHQLQIGNEEITFQARFNGSPFPVKVPVGCIMAIYARENGQGMSFEADIEGVEDSAEVATPAEAATSGDDGPEDKGPPPASGRPYLTRVK